jgi:hypothetical protein
MKEIKHTLPAGKYYIGDPCYALPKEIYNDVWEKKYKFKKGVIPVLGKEFVVSGTEFGDFTYKGTNNKLYGVDSGNISIIPHELCDDEREKDMKRLGSVNQFKEPVQCIFTNGVFKFRSGKRIITIDTRAIDNEDSDSSD